VGARRVLRGPAGSLSDDGFRLGEAASLPSSARAEIWYKATAGNDRFHTYTFQQRVGVLIDWGRCCGQTGATAASIPGPDQ